MSDLQHPVPASVGGVSGHPGERPVELRAEHPVERPDEVPRGPSARVRVGVGAAIVLVVVALVCSVLITALSPVGATTVVTAGGAAGTATPSNPAGSISTAAPGSTAADAASAAGGSASVPEAAGAVILVHLLGAVARPGVYELAEGSRVVDAVGLAGGFTETAEQASVNLARPLADGEQLRVLAIGEVVPAGSGGTGAAAGAAAAAGGVGGSGAAAPAVGAPLDLNTATELDLDALPRIGPAMAARIVGWRTENGRFASVDDLLQVTGIGEKTLEGLRDLVTV